MNLPKKIKLVRKDPIRKQILQYRAKELRQKQTAVEQFIWLHLRNRSLLNCKFRRQFVIGSYIVDFACIEIKLIIELDGGQHMMQTEYDMRRTNYFKSLGYDVLRFWNNEVAFEPKNVLEMIYLEIEKRVRKDGRKEQADK